MTLRSSLFALTLPGIVQAQSWPDRPLRLPVPFAPGAVTDSIGRLSAEFLAARLGPVVVVENRTGAGGAIAVEAVARSRPWPACPVMRPGISRRFPSSAPIRRCWRSRRGSG